MAVRAVLLTIVLAFAALSASAQAGQSDSQTLQAILSELRAIHEEMKTTESSQILLTELQMQQNVVNRAAQHVEEMQAKLSDVRGEQKNDAGELNRLKEQLDRATDQQQVKDFSDKIAELKANISALDAMEQDRSASLDTAQQKLRDAQSSLDEIEDQLSSIVKRMTSPSK